MTDVPLHTSTTGGKPSGRAVSMIAITLAVFGQIVVLVPFTVASGLVAPLWAIVILYGLWFASAFALWRTARRSPLLAPLIPVTNAVLLWLAITGGERLLGWVG